VRPAAALRADFRAGLIRPTAGLAPGVAQANLIAVPRDWAWDMLLYSQRNPRPCPVLDVSDPGSPRTGLADGAAVMASQVPYAISHAPGHMFLTDVPDTEYER
jgi:uncharacterized protein YcsI (UPF0317 family)